MLELMVGGNCGVRGAVIVDHLTCRPATKAFGISIATLRSSVGLAGVVD